MVIRKPMPAGAVKPHSSRSMSASDELESMVPYASQNASQNAFSNRVHLSKPNPSLGHGSARPWTIVSENDTRPYVEEAHTAGKPMPAVPSTGEAWQSLEELDIELVGNPRPGLDAYKKATPRSSLDSERSKEFWEEDSQGDGVTGDGMGRLEQSSRLKKSSTSTIEPMQHIVPQNAQGCDPPLLEKHPKSNTSRNPFRRGDSGNGLIQDPRQLSSSEIFTQHSTDKSSGVSYPELPVEMTANLSLADRPFSEYSTSYRPSTLDLVGAFDKQGPEQRAQMPRSSRPSVTSVSQEPVPSSEKTIDEHQPPLIPVTIEHLPQPSVGASQLSSPSTLNGSSEGHIATKEKIRTAIVPDLEKQLPANPSGDRPPSIEHHASLAECAAMPKGEPASLLSVASQGTHQESSPSPMPPRPNANSSRTAEADLARLKGQRNETYQIKHFNWFDHNSRTLRRSSMLTQNKNGPCPLLALVNALLLGVEDDSRSALGAALRTREQVSLGLIIESLMDELTSDGRGGELTELPDVDELNRFLLMLHTGMTANPRLAAAATPSANLMDARNSTLHLPLLNNDRKPGTFEDTQDMQLYGAFGIPLVHGWLAPRSDPASAAFGRAAQTYEDAQTIQFREEELEEKLSIAGLNAEEQQLLQDISSIKSFLESHPTQITSYGLDVINESLFPGAFAILFRNDHFSTIYKHPELGRLFTLVTDAGYSDKDEVIWESLVDISGQASEFFSGDFRPVGNVGADNVSHRARPDESSARGRAQRSTQSIGLSSPMSPLDQQQQSDADFAMALQLQEEEEARTDDSRRRSSTRDAVRSRDSGMNNSQRLREDDTNRPAIPPRLARNHGVNRTIDPNSDEAPPPAYEEAAKGKPYLPPLGHPQHPSFDARSPTSGPSTPIHPPGPRVGQPHPRRMSAFQENSQYQNIAPLTRHGTNNNIGVAHGSERPRDRDKDCTVM